MTDVIPYEYIVFLIHFLGLEESDLKPDTSFVHSVAISEVPMHAADLNASSRTGEGGSELHDF